MGSIKILIISINLFWIFIVINIVENIKTLEELTMKKTIMKKRISVLFLFFLVPAIITAGEVKNPDRPGKGTHQFPLNEIWRVRGGQDMLFGNVVTLVVSDSEHVFARDLKNREYYALDANGQLLNVFGRKGEGPGQVRDSGGGTLHVIKNKVVIDEPGKFNLYDDQGRYLTSIRKTRGVSLFLSESEYISAPASIAGLPSDKASMRYVNLETGEEAVITDFTVFRSGVIDTAQGTARLVVPSITPMMIFGTQEKRIYYAMNNRYTVYITDIKGMDHGRFSLDRQGEKISLKEREDVLIELAKGYAPREMAIQMAKSLPDRQTCFSSIDSYDGKLYLAQSHFVPVNRQEFDIFSPDGRYLYRGILTIEEGSRIKSEPVFKNNFVYLVIEDEEGEITIAKYQTTLPD